jgi:hypothetical protein
MIRVVHPGSRIPDPDADFLPSRIPDPGVKKVPNPGSRIRIRNTGHIPAVSRRRLPCGPPEKTLIYKTWHFKELVLLGQDGGGGGFKGENV